MKIQAAYRMQAAWQNPKDALRALIKIKEYLAQRAGDSAPEGASENNLAICTAQELADKLETLLILMATGSLGDSNILGVPSQLLAADKYAPSNGDTIEFMSDQFTDKGPATGTISKSFVTVDGPYITVQFADGQETLSWDDIHPYVTRPDPEHWTVQKTKTTAFTLNLKKVLGQ